MTKLSANTSNAVRRSAPLWIDGILFLMIAGLITLVIKTVGQTGIFTYSLLTDDRLTWHLIRALGITSYALLGASTVWGLFLSSKLIKDWSPGTLSLIMHATTSWLAVVFIIFHVVLLLLDKYYTYTVSTVLIPFTSPYRALPVGFGTLALWLILPITISFSMRKLIGQTTWRLLHYFSYIAFGLVTLHALLAGTDSDKMGMRLLVFLFSSVVIGLFTVRITRSLVPKQATA